MAPPWVDSWVLLKVELLAHLLAAQMALKKVVRSGRYAVAALVVH